MNSSNLLLGTFNAEYFWKPADMAGFPAFVDPQSRNLIYAMDDLLALATSDGDQLLTRFGFSTTHKNYLSELGFSFYSNQSPVITPSLNGHKGFQCISEAMELNALYVAQEFSTLKPYSITKGLINLSQRNTDNRQLPEHEVVAKVNSKAFSTLLSQQLSPSYKGEVITASEDLAKTGKCQLERYKKLVLKESYGVAGNGNLIIQSEKTLTQLVRQFKKQEDKGRQVELVLEPLLNKNIDFSSHWTIESDGTRHFLGFQEMVNEGFTFSQIRPLPEPWEDIIQRSDYIAIINKALQFLYQQGYFGPVCFDSMILSDREIVPMVEINARMSMGLLNYHLNERFKELKAPGNLLFLSLTCPPQHQNLYATIQETLQTLQLNFTKESPSGFMVLSANTLQVNATLSPEKPYRARLYLWQVNTKENTLNMDISRLGTALRAKGINVQ